MGATRKDEMSPPQQAGFAELVQTRHKGITLCRENLTWLGVAANGLEAECVELCTRAEGMPTRAEKRLDGMLKNAAAVSAKERSVVARRLHAVSNSWGEDIPQRTRRCAIFFWGGVQALCITAYPCRIPTSDSTLAERRMTRLRGWRSRCTGPCGRGAPTKTHVLVEAPLRGRQDMRESYALVVCPPHVAMRGEGAEGLALMLVYPFRPRNGMFGPSKRAEPHRQFRRRVAPVIRTSGKWERK